MADLDTPIEHVSDTALWVATFRGREGRRKDALFHDPLAALLSGDRGEWIARNMERSKYTGWSVVIRTVLIDAFVKQLIAEGADAVLSLGAGLDTRPYRLELPKDFPWIEVDYEALLAMKNEKLAGKTPNCTLERWAVDLTDAEARDRLLAQVSERAKKVIVLTEGVIPYLDTFEVTELAKALRRHPAMRYWIVDYLAGQARRVLTRGRMGRQMRNAPFKFFVDDWHGFFGEAGWGAREVRYYAEEGERLKRRFPMPLWAWPLVWLAPKERKAAARRMAGYAVLEPKN